MAGSAGDMPKAVTEALDVIRKEADGEGTVGWEGITVGWVERKRVR